MTGSQPPRAALIVTFDQLPASILGCYGNEWIETPHLDRLAADGLVADQCWASHVGPASSDEAFATSALFDGLRTQRVRSSLIRQEATRTVFAEREFQSVRNVTGELGADAKPDRIPFAEMVRAAQAAWSENEGSSLLWLHARGLEIPAEPPAGFAELYRDEFEDRGVKFDSLSEAEQRSHPSTSAGMASLFDHWLGQLFAAMAGDPRPRLTVVSAAQGAVWLPLPNSFGPLDGLRSQIAHVPLICREHSDSSGQRDAHLRSTSQIGELIAAWFREPTRWSLSPSGSNRTVTEAACGERITTLDWAAILPAQNEGKPLLFRRPEDYWEVNNLADVMRDAIEELKAYSERGASAP